MVNVVTGAIVDGIVNEDSWVEIGGKSFEGMVNQDIFGISFKITKY